MERMIPVCSPLALSNTGRGCVRRAVGMGSGTRQRGGEEQRNPTDWEKAEQEREPGRLDEVEEYIYHGDSSHDQELTCPEPETLLEVPGVRV